MADNLACIREGIGARPVKLVAVTKYVGVESIKEAFDCGITEFGESKIQDALEKQELVAQAVSGEINWHFIGHLQTNKVKKAVGRFSLIHSVDSIRLAEEISKTAEKLSIVQPVLLQVKMLPDNSKNGFTPDELRHDLPALTALPGIAVKGLMTITPLSQDVSIWRQCFEGLQELRDELSSAYRLELKELSMGMSQDWREALACGATIVRLGSAIFRH